MITTLSPPQSGSCVGLGPLKILVVDDHAVIGTAVGIFLGRLGHQVDIVADGRTAVEAVTHGDYDAVLMDVLMPGMDGLEATRLIRQSDSHRHRPLIFAMSADDSRDDRAFYLDSGMNDSLPKPVLLPDLAALLERWFPASHSPRVADADPRQWKQDGSSSLTSSGLA